MIVSALSSNVKSGVRAFLFPEDFRNEQAVAALRIAEEARAEAEAAKKAAEEAMHEALDQCETLLKPDSLDEVGFPSILNGWRV